MEPDLTRDELRRGRVQLLNRGGLANPDVLLVRRPRRAALVVKDYAQCWAPVRRLMAPLMIRHELAMLRRAHGLPGLPAWSGRVDGLALAMEHIDGTPLQRRLHAACLPRAFFHALEGVLEGLAQRGLLYTDLRSPSNILVTPSLAPALVDLASAVPVPVPGWLRDWYQGRALAKLSRRFEGIRDRPRPDPPDGMDLDLGSVRLRVVDRGRHDDPVPALLLHDAGQSGSAFSGVLDRAADFSRRAIAVDLPGFGASRGPRRPQKLAAVSRCLDRALDAMRIERVDLVGCGWGGVVARDLATRQPDRVRALVTIDAPVDRIEGRFRERWLEARDRPEALRRRLLSEIPGGLETGPRSILERSIRAAPASWLSQAYRRLPVRQTPDEGVCLALAHPHQPWLAVASEAGGSQDASGHPVRRVWPDPLADPERLWRELAMLVRS